MVQFIRAALSLALAACAARGAAAVKCKRAHLEIVEAWRSVTIPEHCDTLDLTTRNDPFGDRGARALAEAVAHHPRLKELDLSGNHIGDVGATALAEAVRANVVLETLDIYRNHVGDEGAKELADALHSNSHLVRLVLGKNKLTNVGAGYFAAALERDDDPALRELILIQNQIGATGAAALAHAIETRQQRRHPIWIKGLEEAFHHGTHNEL